MSSVWGVCKELVFRVKLYLKGVRFNERLRGNEPLIKCITLQAGDDYEIEFKCYRETDRDKRLIRGRLDTVNYRSYFVEAVFGADAPEVFRNMKNKTIYFSGASNRFRRNEEATLDLMVDLYIDILKILLKNNTLVYSFREQGNETRPFGL